MGRSISFPPQLEDTPKMQSDSCFGTRYVIPYISQKNRAELINRNSVRHVPQHQP
jgi:hypothetical protein